MGMVGRECHVDDKATLGQRRFINSFAADATPFAHAIRNHWGIENKRHWRLDIVFREDDGRVRKGNAPAIMAAIHPICLNLFQKEPSKAGAKKKINRVAWGNDYRAKLLFGA